MFQLFVSTQICQADDDRFGSHMLGFKILKSAIWGPILLKIFMVSDSWRYSTAPGFLGHTCAQLHSYRDIQI